MNNRKATKRALLTSVMALVMCVVMLVGTTFAWFTDTATTSVNTIKSGTLNVQIQDTSGKEISTLEWVDKEGKAIEKQDDILWEPGCTYLLTPFKIVNTGNLALKYKIEITGLDGGAKLLKVIKFTYKVDGTELNLNEEGHLAANGGATGTITISAHMDELAGNEYQNETLTGVKFNVVATQDTVEYDSTGKNYDAKATYPVVAKNQAEVNDAITNATEKNVTIAVPAGQTTTLDNGIANEGSKSRNVTFIGDGSQTVDVAKNAPAAEGAMHLNYQRGSTFTFENLTIENGTDTYDGIVCDELTYKNCTIKGVTTLYGKATFIDCVFENTMTNQYSIWTWGGTDVTFENCTFNTNGKAILLFGEDKTTSLTVNNCKFYDRTDGAAGKAAIEIGDANYGKHNNFTVVINNSTVEQGFAINANGTNTGSKLWANKNSMDAAHLTVTIDGGKVQ